MIFISLWVSGRLAIKWYIAVMDEKIKKYETCQVDGA